MLYGTMIGEAMSLAMQDLSKWSQFRAFGRPPLRYRGLVAAGAPDRLFHLSLLTCQSVLRSRSNSEAFLFEYQRRRRWYQAATPIVTVSSWFRPWKSAYRRQTDLLASGVFLASLLQGTGARASRWLQAIAQETRTEGALPGALLLAHATQFAILDSRVAMHPTAVLANLAEQSRSDELAKILRAMLPLLESRRGVRQVARQMGWGNGIPRNPNAIASMAVYAWLRHPHRFRFMVERSISCGGASWATGTCAAALGGVGLGKSKIPPEWVSGLSPFPYDSAYFDKLIRRLTDWPHGMDDLHSAPAMSSYPLLQVIRNVRNRLAKLVNRAVRFPSIFCASLKHGEKRIKD
jgi:hypothetical protein